MMRRNREEEKLSRLATRKELDDLLYVIPWIERGKFFRFMKRQRWAVGLTKQAVWVLSEFYGRPTNDRKELPPMAFSFFVERLMSGATLDQIRDEIYRTKLGAVK